MIWNFYWTEYSFCRVVVLMANIINKAEAKYSNYVSGNKQRYLIQNKLNNWKYASQNISTASDHNWSLHWFRIMYLLRKIKNKIGILNGSLQNKLLMFYYPHLIGQLQVILQGNVFSKFESCDNVYPCWDLFPKKNCLGVDFITFNKTKNLLVVLDLPYWEMHYLRLLAVLYQLGLVASVLQQNFVWRGL